MLIDRRCLVFGSLFCLPLRAPSGRGRRAFMMNDPRLRNTTWLRLTNRDSYLARRAGVPSLA